MRNYAVTTHGTVATRSVVLRNFVRGGGVSTNSVEDRENADLEGGGSCNLVQEISLHIVKFS